MIRRVLVLTPLVAALTLAAAGGREYTYADLLDRMVDLRGLAQLPQPGEKCYQFSSYDRRSRTPEDRDGWNANADHGKYLRQEGDEYVMAEAEGPAAIVRIWSANPQGTLKIYLDGSTEPQVAAPTKEITIFSWDNPDRRPAPAAKQPAWVFPEPIGTPGVSSVFCGRRSAGWNLYLPMPFKRSLKVTVQRPDDPPSLYYHVNIMSFPPDTRLPTWSLDLVRSHARQLDRIRERLTDPAAGAAVDPQKSEQLFLPPAGSSTFEIAGPAAITAIAAKVSAKDTRSALREVLVTITFDRADQPQVWAPLGDFFGTMPGPNLYASLPLGVTKEVFYSRWYMPFRDAAEIRVVNEGGQEVEITGSASVEHIAWTEDTGYFHAKWRRTPENTTFDWPFIECAGRGRVVGVAMGIFNPVSGWWGEGDEKIWIDGEPFPSTFGTGSEDYFGYAWCNTALFQHAYHNQTLCEGPGNGNHTSVNRWHILDSLPFQRSIRFTIEDWPLGNTIGKDYCATAYWYADRTQRDFFTPVPAADRVPKPAWKPFAIPGIIEGEAMKVTARTGGDADVQPMGGFGPRWSGASQLWWRPEKAGEKLTLEFRAKKGGTFAVTAYLTKSWDYGTFRLEVNGVAAGGPIDLFSGEAQRCVPSGPVALGKFQIAKGSNVLTVQVVGKAEGSPGYFFGLDGIALEEE